MIKEIIACIRRLHTQNGVPPSQSEIAEATGISRQTVVYYFRRLIKEGYIVKEKGASMYRFVEKNPGRLQGITLEDLQNVLILGGCMLELYAGIKRTGGKDSADFMKEINRIRWNLEQGNTLLAGEEFYALIASLKAQKGKAKEKQTTSASPGTSTFDVKQGNLI